MNIIHTTEYTIKHIIIAVYLILTSVQIIALEGYGVSPFKVTLMSMAPILMIIYKLKNNCSKPIIYGGLCLTFMMICSALGGHDIYWNRIGYRAMYIMMFVCIYSIIYDGDIELRYVVKLIKIIILAYGITFIIQYALYYLGIREMPIINYYRVVTMAGTYKANGLAIESSHAGRILTVLYWGVLKLTEIEQGKIVSFKQTWKDFPLVTILFWLSILSMGSATAMIGGIIIIISFFRKNIGIALCGIALLFVLVNIDVENNQLKRVQTVYNSMFAEDARTALMKSEGSGAVRIMPILNTFSIDLLDSQSWIGQGNDQETNAQNFIKRMFSETRYIGDVESYGLLTYIVTLLFVYGCCIKKFFSMESLIFLGLATFSVGSVYYTWLMLMIFSIVKYYTETYTPQLE